MTTIHDRAAAARLKPYMAYDRSLGVHEGAVLVWAHSVREARRVAHPEISGYGDGRWIDCAARLIRSCTLPPEKAEPHIADAPLCTRCEYWHAHPVNEAGLCRDCQEDEDTLTSLYESTGSTHTTALSTS